MAEAPQPPGTGSPQLDLLEAWLASDRAPEDAMGLSELDGFLTGIVVGPQTIMPSEWLPLIWGGDEPVFADAAEAETVLGAIMAHYNEIILKWSPSAGQFGGLDKLGSSFRQAANLSISPASYASSGVCPARALCGRAAL
jgi:hypothetical protein